MNESLSDEKKPIREQEFTIVDDAFEDEPLPSHQKLLSSKEFLRKFKYVDFKDGKIGCCGVPVGSNSGRIYVCDEPFHVALEAATGRGKSRGVTLPYSATCCLNGESQVYITTKSSDVGYIYDEAKQNGQEPVVFNFVNPELSDSTNILSVLKIFRSSDNPWAKLKGEILANRIANIAIDAYQSRTGNFEWVIGTMMVCYGLLLFAVDHLPGRTCNTLALAQILDALIDDKDTEVKKEVLKNPKYKNLLSPILLSEAMTTKEGYKSVFYSMAMSSLCNPAYAQILSGGDKDVTHLDEKPGTVIMLVSEGDYSSMTAASILLTVMHMAMIDRIESSPTARAKVRVNIIIDEFGMMYLPMIDEWLSQGRVRGLRYLLSFQSEGQLLETYGVGLTQSILANCRLKIFMGSQDKDSIDKYVSQLGTMKEDPLISADQLRKMNCGQALVLCDGMDPYFGKMADFSTQVPLYPLIREKQEYREVPIPDVTKWYKGCEEQDLLMCWDPESAEKNGITIVIFSEEEFKNMIYEGIDRTKGAVNVTNLSYGLLESFLLNMKDKNQIIWNIDARVKETKNFDDTIQRAIRETRRKISIMSQTQLDSIYESIIRK